MALHPLKKYRQSKGISAAGMARKIGMHRSSIERIERYQQLPPIDTILLIAKATGLDATDFFPPKGK